MPKREAGAYPAARPPARRARRHRNGRNNGHLYKVDPEGAGWIDYGGTITDFPSAVVQPDGHTVDPSGAGWINLGGSAGGIPAAIVQADGHTIAFVRQWS